MWPLYQQMGKRSRNLVVNLFHVADQGGIQVRYSLHERLMPTVPDDEDTEACLPVDSEADQDGADEESDNVEHVGILVESRITDNEFHESHIGEHKQFHSVTTSM